MKTQIKRVNLHIFRCFVPVNIHRHQARVWCGGQYEDWTEYLSWTRGRVLSDKYDKWQGAFAANRRFVNQRLKASFKFRKICLKCIKELHAHNNQH